jgi:sialidase-1
LIPTGFPGAIGRLTLAAIPLCSAIQSPAAEPTHADVYLSGQGGYHTYRIPALLVTRGGALLAFCEGRKTSRSDHGDLDLVVRRSTDNGRSWSEMQIVYEEGGEQKITIGNPCPVVDQSTGTIWLPFTRDNDSVLLTHSADDGLTWSPPVDITSEVKRPDWGWYATGPGVGIQLTRGEHSGRLVIPCDHREKIDGRDVMHSHVFYSDDAGANWQLGGSVARHTDECQVVELTDGRLMINMRNYWGRAGGQPENGSMRAVAHSDDGGRTWGPLRFGQTLIEPVCQASFIRHVSPSEDGPRNVLLFSNPASKTTRERMTVRASFDEGQTWPVSKTLYPGPAAYSCLAQLPDSRIGLLYERDDYGRISFAVFTMDWLSDGRNDTTDKH